MLSMYKDGIWRKWSGQLQWRFEEKIHYARAVQENQGSQVRTFQFQASDGY